MSPIGTETTRGAMLRIDGALGLGAYLSRMAAADAQLVYSFDTINLPLPDLSAEPP